MVERSVSVLKHTSTLLELRPDEPVHHFDCERELYQNEDGYKEAVNCIEKKLKQRCNKKLTKQESLEDQANSDVVYERMYNQ